MSRETRNTGAPRPDMTLRWGSRILFLTALIVITDLALQPATGVPASLLGSDKLEHMAAFAALTVLSAMAWPSLPRLLTLPLLLLYGIAIEIAQNQLGNGRVASIGDIIADAAGIALATGLVVLARRLSRVGS